MKRIGLALLALLTTTGCGRTPEVSHFTVTEVDGVRVVENRDIGWTAEDAWTLDPTPIMEIGGTDADSLHWQYDVMDLRRLRDGRIAAASYGTRDVRIYDPAGRFLRIIGGRGQGPGEFQAPWWIVETPGDSLLVEDIGGGFRFNLFTPDGVFFDRCGTEVSRGVEGTELLGQFGDGTLLVQRHERDVRTPEPGIEGVTRNMTSFFRVSHRGTLLDSLGLFPNQSGKGEGGFLSYLWGPWAHADAGPTGFYFGGASRFEIERRDLQGRLVGRFLLERSGRPVTSAEFEEWKERFVAGQVAQGVSPASVDFLRKSLERMEHAAVFPPYFQVLADEAGNVWAQEYIPEIGEGRLWSIFDSTGVFLGDLAMPERFRVKQIGADFVLGIWRDDLDVQHLRMYRIRKPLSR